MKSGFKSTVQIVKNNLYTVLVFYSAQVLACFY